VDFKKLVKFTKLQPLSFMEKFKKFLKVKLLHFIQDLLMVLLRYMRIGLQKITERPMGFLQLMGFYSIMNLKEEERLL
jgi:hypothetical protein